MTRAIIEFDLSDIDDLYDFEVACSAKDMQLLIWDIDQLFRRYWKSEELNEQTSKIVEKIFDEYIKTKENYNIVVPR
jgi:hypothetical protein